MQIKLSDLWTQHRIALLVLIIAIAIRIPFVILPISPVENSWRAADTASIARNFAENGYHLLYPQINWGGTGPGYVEAEFQFYPFIVAVLYHFFGDSFWMGRLVSLFFTVLACIVFYALARRLLKPYQALWAFAFFVISPVYLRFSTEFMPEATCFFFYISALYLFQSWLDEQRPRLLWLAGISTAFAILVKPTAAHIGLIFALMVLNRFGWKILKRPAIYLFGAISLLPGAAWFLHARDLYLQYGNTFGVISGGDSKFGHILDYWLSPRFYASLLSIEASWILAYGGVIIFAIGFVLYWREHRWSLLVFGTITMPIYYMLVPRYTGDINIGLHYHIYFVPFAALGVGIGMAWLFAFLQDLVSKRLVMHTPRVLVGVPMVALVLVSCGYDYRQLTKSYTDRQIACAPYVQAVVPVEDRIIVTVNDRAYYNGVPNNYQDPRLFYFSHRFGWALPIEQQTPEQVEALASQGGKILVITESKLYDTNPMLAFYLSDSTTQIGPGLSAGCAIYKLNKPQIIGF